MSMHPSLLILLVGLIYLLGFGALSYVRREGLSVRFAVEGLAVTALGAVLTLAAVAVNPALFLLLLYLITMRVRLLVDLGNWFAARGRFDRALDLYRLATRMGPDTVSRQIVLINRGATELRMQEPATARETLKEALLDEEVQPGAKYLAAGYYNLGLACRRAEHEAEAIRCFNQAIDILPTSIYAHAAKQALKQK